MTQRSYSFTFTINNYTDEDIKQLEALECQYIVYGKEVSTTGTPHLQGYTKFSTQRTLSSVSKKIKRAHLEVARVDVAAAKYCQKDGDFTERGEPPKTKEEKGKEGGEAAKRKYEEVRDLAKAGNLDEISEKYPGIWLRSYSTLKKIKVDHMPKLPDLDGVCGTWIVGPAGCGKTRLATKLTKDLAYWKPADNAWWDGYQGEADVVLDDVDKFMVKMAYHMKIWAHQKPFIAETKGGSMNIRPTRIIVTSQYTIDEIWEDDKTRDALNRRFKVIDMGEPKVQGPADFEGYFDKSGYRTRADYWDPLKTD